MSRNDPLKSIEALGSNVTSPGGVRESSAGSRVDRPNMGKGSEEQKHPVAVGHERGEIRGGDIPSPRGYPLSAGVGSGEGAVPWNHGTKVGGAFPLLVQSWQGTCPRLPRLWSSGRKRILIIRIVTTALN